MYKKEGFIKNISSEFFSERGKRRNTARSLKLVDFICLAKQPWMDLLGFMFRNKHVVLHYIPFTHFVLQTYLTSNCTTPWLAGTVQNVVVRDLLKARILEQERCFGGWVLMDALSHLLSVCLFPQESLSTLWERHLGICVVCSQNALWKDNLSSLSVSKRKINASGLPPLFRSLVCCCHTLLSTNSCFSSQHGTEEMAWCCASPKLLCFSCEVVILPQDVTYMYAYFIFAEIYEKEGSQHSLERILGMSWSQTPGGQGCFVVCSGFLMVSSEHGAQFWDRQRRHLSHNSQEALGSERSTVWRLQRVQKCWWEIFLKGTCHFHRFTAFQGEEMWLCWKPSVFFFLYYFLFYFEEWGGVEPEMKHFILVSLTWLGNISFFWLDWFQINSEYTSISPMNSAAPGYFLYYGCALRRTSVPTRQRVTFVLADSMEIVLI